MRAGILFMLVVLLSVLVPLPLCSMCISALPNSYQRSKKTKPTQRNLIIWITLYGLVCCVHAVHSMHITRCIQEIYIQSVSQSFSFSIQSLLTLYVLQSPGCKAHCKLLRRQHMPGTPSMLNGLLVVYERR